MGGIRGQLGRTLVFLNYPTSLVAVVVTMLAAARLRTRAATGLAALSIALSVPTAVPGVVDQGDLDARPVNVLPAIGVALCVVLAFRGRERLQAPRRLALDHLRIALGVVLGLLVIPWLFAELGFYAPDPLLAEEVPPGETIAAVHLGNHHGTNGVYVAAAMLLLSRLLPTTPGRRTRAVASAIAAGLLAWGLVNAVQDAWLEQVVKRGWTDAEIPSVIRPELSVAWGVIVLLAVAIEVFWFRRERSRERYSSSSPHSDIGT